MQLKNNYSSDIINKISISCIASIMQLILLIPIIVLFYYTIYSFNIYGWAILDVGELPVIYNTIRSWWLFLSIFYLALLFINLRLIIIYKLYGVHNFIFWLSSLVPFSSIYLFVILIKNRYLKIFIRYIFSNKYETQQIDHKEFIDWLKGKISINKVIRNTILYYFTLLIFSIGLILIFIPTNDQNSLNKDEHYFIFNVASYFTQQNNILCWLFLFFFFFFNKKRFFAHNTLLTYNTSYIFIVGLVANVMIVPYLIFNNINEMITLNIVKFFWLHLINQIFFIWFAINTFSINKEYKLESTYDYYSKGVIYPIFYGIYLYTLPFIARHSVYGWLTNLNWMMKTVNGTPAGSPIVVLGLLGLIGLFIFTLWFFRRLNKIIIKNSQKFY